MNTQLAVALRCCLSQGGIPRFVDVNGFDLDQMSVFAVFKSVIASSQALWSSWR